MLRRTFLGTLAAMPIIGLPLRAIGRAVPYETSRLIVQWQDQDAPEVTLVTYSDESVRCWLGTTELTNPVMIQGLRHRILDRLEQFLNARHHDGR